MAGSTYSNLKIQLMSTGENASTWGDVTNVNIGAALGAAIASSVDIPFTSANVTLSWTDTNGPQDPRYLRLNLTGSPASDYSLIVPAILGGKPYIVNNGTGRTITVKNATGTGIAVPTGKTMWVYNNGTNVVDAITHLTTLTLGTALPATSGGTGLNAPGTAGNVLVSDGSAWISQSGGGVGGNGVSTITFASTGLTPATATNGAVTVAGTLVVANGGTGKNTHTSGAVLIGAGTSAFTSVSPGTSGNVLASNGTAWVSQAGGGSSGVSSITFGSTGLTPSTATNGTVTVAGTLAVTNGGTGGATQAAARTGIGAAASGANTDITSLNTTTTINGVVIGYRNIPRSTTTTTANIADVGKCIAVSANITFPNAVFAAGDVVSIYNTSGSAITIIPGTGFTMYLAGTGTSANRTLAQHGVATIWCNSTSDGVITGGGLT